MTIQPYILIRRFWTKQNNVEVNINNELEKVLALLTLDQSLFMFHVNQFLLLRETDINKISKLQMKAIRIIINDHKEPILNATRVP